MKVSLVEYGSGIAFDHTFSATLSAAEFKVLIERANFVIKQALRINRESLVISDGKLRALGIAGTIKLSKDLELEIIPKMLNNSGDGNWKESLFLLAALSKYGNIITTEHIHSSAAYKDSLYDIAGRILAREYSVNKRKPIRQYRKKHFVDFSISGDIDFERVFEKNPDGIPQSRVAFDKINPFNAIIQAAMRIVLPYVKDSSTRERVSRAIHELEKQKTERNIKLRLPARNKEWSDIYNLAFDIVSGMGSSLESGEILSPSFIVDTWRIWEWLIIISMKIGLSSNYKIIPQSMTTWGIKRSDGKSYKVNVYPDVAIIDKSISDNPIFLIDAKYKRLPELGNIEIERADLYEAFAFCHASDVKQLFLVYPAVADKEHECGSISCMATYEIKDIKIKVIKVAFGSVTKQGDITSFCRRMASNILAVV